METESFLWIPIFTITLWLLRAALKGSIVVGNKKLSGKLVIVTGANSGIGYEIALELARRDARVVLACRSEPRGLKAQNDIRQQSGNENVWFRSLDLASFASIRKFANDFREEEGALYALVNNAGLFWVPHRETEDGIESNFGVNHLGHFLLTILLIPLLGGNGDGGGKIVTVGSLMYMFGKIDFTDLNFKTRPYGLVKAYADSKLANLLTTREMARRLRNPNIRTYCADPGIVATKIGKESALMGSFLYQYIIQPILIALFMRTPPEGAHSAIYCLCSDDVANETGQLYSGVGRDEMWPSALDEKAAEKLWQVSVELTKLRPQELLDFVT